MGRPSKPVSVNKKHLTNDEKEQRLKYESALLSGKKITERKRVREDKTAHTEFKRVVGLCASESFVATASVPSLWAFALQHRVALSARTTRSIPSKSIDMQNCIPSVNFTRI